MQSSNDERPKKTASLLDRGLSVFADVRPGEGLHTVFLAANVFVLLFAYYLLKVLREPLILQQPSDVSIKSYASGIMAVLLVPVIYAFARLSERVNRLRLVSFTTAFFAMNLVLFYVCVLSGWHIGRAFFVWTGIFNMFVVSQFWAFANDLHSPEQGQRLFAIVAIGSCAGSIVGSQYAKRFFDPAHPGNLMIVSAVLLVLSLVLTSFVHSSSKHATEAEATTTTSAPLAPSGSFTLLLRDPYLLLIALLTLVYNGVNSLGEFVLDRVLVEESSRVSTELAMKIADFRADFYSWVNLFALLLQLFAVSRIMKFTFVRGALFVMPLISLVCYGSMGLAANLLVIFWAKVSENSLDYSVQSTTRQALFLVTAREAKYKAKVLVDTFFARAGDTLAALVVFVGTQLLPLGTKGFVLVNIGLICAWLVVAFFIAREHRRRSHGEIATTSVPPVTVPPVEAG